MHSNTIGALIVALAIGIWAAPMKAEEHTQTKSVGPVDVSATLSTTELTIGDQATLTLVVTAESGVDLLMPEFGELLRDYPISEFVPRKRIQDDGRIEHTQIYRFQVVTSGKKTILPILIEFVDNRPGMPPAPEGLDAFELLTDPIEFTVKSILPSNAADQLQPPMPRLELPAERTQAFWTIPIALVVALVVVALAIPWFMRRGKQTRQRNAYEIARLRLDRLMNDQLSSHPSLTAEQFFVEVSSLVRQYLEDRFDVRAPELTTDEFLQIAAQESDLSQQHQSLLGEFLQQADIVKFAGIDASREEIRRSSDLASQFLEETRAREDGASKPDQHKSPPGAPQQVGSQRSGEHTHA